MSSLGFLLPEFVSSSGLGAHEGTAEPLHRLFSFPGMLFLLILADS